MAKNKNTKQDNNKQDETIIPPAEDMLTQEQIDALMGYETPNTQESTMPENDDGLMIDEPSDEAHIKMQEIIVALQQQIDQLTIEKDDYLRAASEAENIRRRAVKEKDDALKYGGMKLARDILPAIDTLQQALTQPPTHLDNDEKFTGFLNGLTMTAKMFTDTLEAQSIMPVAHIGDKFDPNMHQAVSEIPITDNDTQISGTIAMIMQQGFMLHDRLIRAAMVAVYK